MSKLRLQNKLLKALVALSKEDSWIVIIINRTALYKLSKWKLQLAAPESIRDTWYIKCWKRKPFNHKNIKQGIVSCNRFKIHFFNLNKIMVFGNNYITIKEVAKYC